MWIIFVDFSLAPVTPIPCLICLYSGNFSCSVKKAKILLPYYFSHDPLCKLYFQGILCLKPCLLILNSQIPCPNLIFFYKFFICVVPYKYYFESISCSE